MCTACIMGLHHQRGPLRAPVPRRRKLTGPRLQECTIDLGCGGET